MREKLGALKPFWIYFGILVAGCIIFFICPLLLFLFLPLAFILVFVWIVIVFLIGSEVQQRLKLGTLGKRIALAFLCSLIVLMIFPVGFEIYDFIEYQRFSITDFLEELVEIPFWIAFAVHSAAFWAGEEFGRIETT